MAYSFFCNEILDSSNEERCIKVNDTYTELFLYFFIEILEEKKNLGLWFSETLLNNYIEQSQGSRSSYMTLYLTDLFLDSNKFVTYVDLLNEVKEFIASIGDTIPPEFGNKYVNPEYQSKYTKPIKSEIIIDLIDHIKWLLGLISEKPSNRFNTKSDNGLQ